MDEKTVLVNEKAVTEALVQTAVFRSYVDLINAERSTMWARHNAMLVANSLIFSAIAISETEQWADLALIGAGLFISCVWLYVTVEGWAVVHLHVQIAGKAEAAWFRTLPNPFSPAIYGKAQVTIYRLMLIVILVFILMYLGLAGLRLA
jgi:hypothetical protein